MNKEIDKKYNHLVVENNKYKYWKENNLLEPKNSNKFFSIILPPPNVTGHLHLGHAWDVSYQDLLIRYKRLCGYSALWLPGTDHAGIATQTKFEAILKKEYNKTRFDFTKDEFLNKLWSWKESQANFIHEQWAKLGLSLSYQNEKFTMDKNVNLVVNMVFKHLYDKGLIYKAKKLVNWDINLKTAISNIEVIYKETNSKMYYFKYYTQDKDDYVIVATTRPETMFGDVALVANPKDERYLKYKNKKFINPANNELLDIIFDSYIDIDFGTGIMKCTPSHDFNDNKLSKKHNLKMINIMNPDGTMNDLCHEFEGLDRLICREKLVEKLNKLGLLIKTEDIINNIGYSERTNAIVEPYLSNEWFIKMDVLAKNVIDNPLQVNFVPERFKKTLFQWLTNIEDWCISRQLWWGHQIPIWYHKKTNEIYCDIKPPKDSENWIQDDNVLDTWFSSSLWPLIMMNWPDENNYIFKNYFPSDVLVTGYDIIFFWVSRMIMQSLELTDQIPFKNVLIHGLIRDENGRKMSKSLGNGIDPMDVINEYGADALRMFLTSSSTIGDDLNFSKQKLSYYWNFINKLWNGYRFIYQTILEYKHKIDLNIDINKLSIIDKEIIFKLNHIIKVVTNNFDQYNFVVANKNLIDFIWDDYMNNYLELCKIQLKHNNLYCLNVLIYILKEILILLHPQACFVTEEIYQSLFNNQSIMDENWPQIKYIVDANQIIFAKYINDIFTISKKIRKDFNLKRTDSIKLTIFDLNKNNINKQLEFFKIYLNDFNIILDDEMDQNSINFITNNLNIYFHQTINKQELLNNLLIQKEKILFEYNRAKNILSNENFIKKANKDKIKLEQEKLDNYQKQLEIVNDKINKCK